MRYAKIFDVDQTRRNGKEGVMLSVTEEEGGAHECVADGYTWFVVGLTGGDETGWMWWKESLILGLNSDASWMYYVGRT